MTQAIATKPQFTERQLHLDQLRFDPKVNARPEGDEAQAVDEDQDEGEVLRAGMPMPMLMASIEAVGGIVLPLIVVDMHKKDGKGRALYSVAAGGRRLRALLALRKANRLSCLTIPCREVSEATPMLISLIENMAREPMKPVDECVAFGELIAAGQSVESIAATFAVDVRHVHQRLALGKLHPELLKLLRFRQMSMDAAKALTLEPDQVKQLAVWKKLPAYQRHGYAVRNALTHQDVRAGDRLVRFVTLDAYRAAGGAEREDLFQQAGSPDSLILTDPGLVESLAAAKLQEKAESMLGQGWGWAEVVQETHTFEIQRVAQARKLQRVDARGVVERASAGYFVYCDHSGHMQIDGPYMASKEAKAKERANGAATGEGEAAEFRTPDSLMVSLTAHKSAALQSALMQNQRVTLALLAAQAMADYDGRTPLNVRFDNKAGDIERNARGYEQTKPALALAAADKAWSERIPEDADVFAWFMEQPEAVSVEAIAYAAVRSFSIVNARDAAPQCTQAVQQALGFSLAEHFKPTVQTYLGQVPKAQILQAVTQACGKEAAAPLEGMKKGELAAAAEAKLAATDWVPEVIR